MGFVVYRHRLLFIFNIIAHIPLLLRFSFLYPKGTLLFVDSIFGEGRFVLYLRQDASFFLLSWRIGYDILFIDLHKFDQFMNGMRAFRLQILIFLHIPHLLEQFENQRYKLFLIGLLVLIEFDDAFLHDIEQRIYAMIIGLLLKASGKTRINRHSQLLL